MISRGRSEPRFEKRAVNMSDLIWLTGVQMSRLDPYFANSHDKFCVEGKRVLSLWTQKLCRRTLSAIQTDI
ncbi:hypothetical protein DL239_14705 [Sedimentitalea sp. CY04]|uniref:Uncharacterized protein n=1 Tax=Parasedimentitalea denitrificans TaxID=2211118 RepID=A0ABX0W9W8_9RHOB|nr:hypothetical protein [Sedimentitalea sp. CY04]